jgi:hypothetical protein
VFAALSMNFSLIGKPREHVHPDASSPHRRLAALPVSGPQVRVMMPKFARAARVLV